eukprot:CAMPEP_0172685252 /NCGR_PEP_ID=MMETSP1074-20121228/20104_1 /TAXON_ID=2916 /ORGANISM="Ceratium fusus, Strain PA161109" /LENGTH=87 /DNA_ID=CAMNT_0013504361 /DNA_START=237 /DNA_END=500 /DNA_ORIENTATION=-
MPHRVKDLVRLNFPFGKGATPSKEAYEAYRPEGRQQPELHHVHGAKRELQWLAQRQQCRATPIGPPGYGGAACEMGVMQERQYALQQ